MFDRLGIIRYRWMETVEENSVSDTHFFRGEMMESSGWEITSSRFRLTVWPPVLLCLMVGCGFAFSCPAGKITSEQAYTLVKKDIFSSPQQRDVYLSAWPLAAGNSVPTWGRTVAPPSSYGEVWFLFVDDQPGANWEHSCRYIFVDLKTADFTIVEASTPPDDWQEMKKIPPEN